MQPPVLTSEPVWPLDAFVALQLYAWSSQGAKDMIIPGLLEISEV